MQVYRGESREDGRDAAAWKESSSYVNNMQSRWRRKRRIDAGKNRARMSTTCNPVAIQIAKLQKLECRQVELQNEEDVDKVIMEGKANDISKWKEHNTLYLDQLVAPRSLTVTGEYRSYSINGEIHEITSWWRYYGSVLAMFSEPCTSTTDLRTPIVV